MATASLHRKKAKKLLEKIGMGHAIPYLVPAAGHYMTSGVKSLITIQGVRDLPQELDMMMLLPMLMPNFLPPWQQKPLKRGAIPTFVSYNSRQNYLVQVFHALEDTFKKLLLVSKAFRRLLLNPFFRRSLYRLWYTGPIEGLDGRPDYSLSHRNVRMEIPRAEVPGLIDMVDDEDGSAYQRLHARWYRLFLRTVAFNYDLRFMYLTSYRLQKLLTLGFVNLGGNTPQIITVGPAWREGSEKRDISKGRYYERKPGMARTVSVHLGEMLGLLSGSLSTTATRDFNTGDIGQFLRENGMHSYGVFARMRHNGSGEEDTRLGSIQNMMGPPDRRLMEYYLGRIYEEYEKLVRAGRQTVAYHDGNKMTRTLEVEALRVPTVMRPQAFVALRKRMWHRGHDPVDPELNPKTIGFYGGYSRDHVAFGVKSTGLPELKNIPTTIKLLSIPEIVLIWDKPVILKLSIAKEHLSFLTTKERNYLEPTVFNIGTIRAGESLYVNFMRLANPNRTREVFKKLLSHLDYPEAQEHFKHPLIRIKWGLVIMGPQYTHAYHMGEEFREDWNEKKARNDLVTGSTLPKYLIEMEEVSYRSVQLWQGGRRVFRSKERIKFEQRQYYEKQIQYWQRKLDEL